MQRFSHRKSWRYLWKACARPDCRKSEPAAAISTIAVRRRTFDYMGAVPFDTLKLARRLESAGFSPKQAGDTAEALAEAMSGAELATKADVGAVRADLTGEVGAEGGSPGIKGRAEGRDRGIKGRVDGGNRTAAARSDDPPRRPDRRCRRRTPGRDPLSADPSPVTTR